jgi:hypothetical protein
MPRSELSDGDLLDALRVAQAKIPQRDDPKQRHDAWQEVTGLVRELERRYPPSPEPRETPGAANEDRVASRASLLPEEAAAGTDNAQRQADAILADSDARSANLESAPGSFVEHRTSDDATAPPEMGGAP